MNTKEVATRLVEYCRRGEYEKAQKELFANDAISIELHATPEFEKETKGLQAILEKGYKFEKLVEEFHSTTVSDPVIAGNCFAVAIAMDVTMQKMGRMNVSEIAVYHVKDGKVISEEFFM